MAGSVDFAVPLSIGFGLKWVLSYIWEDCIPVLFRSLVFDLVSIFCNLGRTGEFIPRYNVKLYIIYSKICHLVIVLRSIRNGTGANGRQNQSSSQYMFRTSWHMNENRDH